MDFRILGPIEAIDGGRRVALGGSKQRALFSMLLLHANEVVASDRLIAELWPNDSREEAIRSLHVAVSRLRRALEPGRCASDTASVLVTRPPGYELRIDPARLDAKRFEALATEGRQALAAGDAVAARAKLEEALSLWRGAALAELAYESFCQGEIARLDELRMTALEDRIAADLRLGRHAEVVAELRALVREEPLRERLQASLILALYRSGRQAQALEAYTDARRTLVRDVGIEPGRELRELQQAVLRQAPELELSAELRQVAASRDSPFVGRDRELAELAAGLEDALAGHGRLFLIAGEPGIGKSRLAQELMERARARGARVVAGRCWEAGGAPAYWPWELALRALVREIDPAALRSRFRAAAGELAQIVPELREHLPGWHPAPASDSEASRVRLFDATAEFLREASGDRATVVFLDDVHAADASSLLLLTFVARALPRSRVLVLAAYRDVDPPPGPRLRGTLGELAREPATRRLALAGLSEQEVAVYLRLTAPDMATSPELRALLYDETEGNPLFVAEVVRLLVEEGRSPADVRSARLAVPQTIREVIGRRLSQLSDRCHDLLVLASVLGREFALDALAIAGQAPEDEVLDALDEAMAAHLAVGAPGTPGRLRFAHVLVRDTLYEELTAARRVRLHRQALEALEALYHEEPGPHLAELAHHAIAGAEPDKGTLYAWRAGDRALGMFAYEEAARLYAAALHSLELEEPRDERARCELLLSCGDAETRAGNAPAANEAFVAAARIARRLHLPRELARAAAGYGGRIVWGRAGEDPLLRPMLEEALAALGDQDAELRARLLARLAGALRDEPSRARRDGLSREAVELARRSGNLAALAYALDGRAASIIAPDTIDECRALGTELRDVAERAGDIERVLAGHSHRFIAQLLVGDFEGARRDLDAASQIADTLRQPAQLWQVCGWRAMLALAAGRLADAEELIPQALLLGQRAQRSGAIPVYWVQRYTLCDLRGRLQDVEPAIDDLATEHPCRPIFRCVLAHLHVRLGRMKEAQHALDELAEAGSFPLPFDQEWLFSISLLAETSARLGDGDAASSLYRLLLPHAALNVVDVAEGIRGSVARYLGLLAATTKRWEDAERHFQHAIQANAAWGVRPWLAWTQQDYAEMLLARGTPGEAERAQVLLSEARGATSSSEWT
jgi:DNA-binding SARP family transcriptional activator